MINKNLPGAAVDAAGNIKSTKTKGTNENIDDASGSTRRWSNDDHRLLDLLQEGRSGN
jgi:hypothetical protein